MSKTEEQAVIQIVRSSQDPVTRGQRLTQWFSSMTIVDKGFHVIIILLILSGFILVPILNVKLYTIQQVKCNLPYNWSTTGITALNTSNLTSPQSIFVRSGYIYISDVDDTPIIYQMATSSLLITAAIVNSDMTTPQSIYVNLAGTVIYVSDSDASCVYQYASMTATSYTVVAGTCGTSGNSLSLLNAPYAISFDSTETYMYVADSNNNRIIRFPSTSTAGSNGVVVVDGSNGGMSMPAGVYYDSSSNYLYIADIQTNAILKWRPFAPRGTVIIGTGLFSPMSVYFDSSSNIIYVNDAGNARIAAYCENNYSGQNIAGTGLAGSGLTQFNFPYAFAFDTSTWNLFVADTSNVRIQKFSKI